MAAHFAIVGNTSGVTTGVVGTGATGATTGWTGATGSFGVPGTPSVPSFCGCEFRMGSEPAPCASGSGTTGGGTVATGSAASSLDLVAPTSPTSTFNCSGSISRLGFSTTAGASGTTGTAGAAVCPVAKITR
ncbi:MAG: hypothetical protein DWH86_02650 [Planctomycetota bacterium]|nr:MAG: hypothetical protein DWH86_02650 [Planctomycetota bacterium]